MTDTEIAERFARDTKDHRLTVLRDEGLYRHLRFASAPEGYSEYWFELITWPGVLVIRGDMETFAFSRTEDMLTFFRRTNDYRINPGYWAEKLLAPKPHQVKEYSEGKFRQYVTADAEEAEKEWPGLTEAAIAEIFEDTIGRWDPASEHGAREALRDFEFGKTWTACCHCGESMDTADYFAAERWRSGHITAANTSPRTVHRTAVQPVAGFTFTDTWEWDFTDWSYQYLWCCHAIVWGIRKYDEHKAALAERETAGA